MKNIAKTIVTIAALATISSASAVSIVDTLASPFYTAAALLELTIVAPTASTAATLEAREEAVKIQAEVEVYDATGEVSTLLESKIELLKKNDTFKKLEKEELISLLDETTMKVLDGESLK